MAILTGATITIPEAQLKVRWRETYASEGLNKALGMLDPGCYRGGYLEAQSSPNQTVKITAGTEQDNSWLWTDLATGAALVVRYLGDVAVISLASAFTGGGGTMPTTTTYYVYLDCTYSSGVATTGHFYVDTTPASGNAIPIGRIVIPGGATTILNSYINVGGAYRKVAQLDRVVLKRTAAIFTPSGTPLAFHLTGKVYLPGGTAGLSDKAQYVQMAGAGSYYAGPVPYVGSDNGVIYTTNLWANAAGTTPITADSEGFVLDPYVTINTSLTSDTSPPAGVAWYWTRAVQRDLVELDDFKGAFAAHPHADQVQTRDVAGTPTAIASSTVGGAVATLLGAVNERISTIAPDGAPAAPVLLWRSHNIWTDAAVSTDTTSIYWGTTLGLALVTGAYINGANFVEAPVGALGPASMLRLTSNDQIGVGLFTKNSGFTTLAWNTLGSWDTYVRNGDLLGVRLWDVLGQMWFNNGVVLAGVASTLGLLTQDNFLWGNLPGTGGLDKYCHLFQSAALTSTIPRLHIYYAASGSLVVTSNAYWDDPSSRWKPDLQTADAWMLVFNDVGFGLYRKDHDNYTMALEWFDAPGTPTWDTAMIWGSELTNRLAAFPAMVGDYFDVAKLAMGAVSGATGFQRGYSAVTWHAALAVGVGLTVTATADDCYPSTGSWTITTIPDVVGCVVEGVTTASIAEGNFYYWEGTIYAHS